MRNFVSRVLFVYPEKKRLFPLFACCVLAAAFFAACGAAASLAFAYPETPQPPFGEWLPAALVLLAAVFGFCGRLSARGAQRRAAALAADFALRTRRGAFRQLFSSGAGWPPVELEAAIADADILAAAAAFLVRFFFLLFLTACLAAAAALLPQSLPLFAFCFAALPAAGLVCRPAAGREKKRSLSLEREKLEKKLSALEKSVFPARLAALAAEKPVDFPAKELKESAAGLFLLRQREYTAAVFPAMLCAAGLSIALCAYAGNFVSSPGAGGWFFCFFYIAAVFAGAAGMASFSGRLRAAGEADKKLAALLEREALVQSSPAADVPARNLKGEIRLSGVSVPAKDAGASPLLDAVSLEIYAGQKTALVSLDRESPAIFLRVLARLCEYSAGELLIDGKDIRAFDMDEFRLAVDFAPRGAFLFEGTLEENIRCGRLSASEEEMRGAALKLGRGDWLYDLPDGLDTRADSSLPVPVWAPLVQLTRTLLKNPAVCLIEECGPVEDALTEVRIQEALISVAEGRTAVIAARRLSTLRDADRIIVFDKGRPVEDGAHRELLARGGLYAEICENFFRRGLPDSPPEEDEASAGGKSPEAVQPFTAEQKPSAAGKPKSAGVAGNAAKKPEPPVKKTKPAAVKPKTKPAAPKVKQPATVKTKTPATPKVKPAAAPKVKQSATVKAKTPTMPKPKSAAEVKAKAAAKTKAVPKPAAAPKTKPAAKAKAPAKTDAKTSAAAKPKTKPAAAEKKAAVKKRKA